MLLDGIFKLLLLETTLLVTLFIICLKLFFVKKKQGLTIENLTLYNQTLTNMYDGIRSLKHDFINFIQCLKGYTLCDDMGGVKEMVDSVYNESKNICNMEALNPKVINNPAIYNLLLNKYQYAYSNNITMNIEVNINLQEINLNIYTLCKMLGILVDNAIEAAKNCDEKIVFVRFIEKGNAKAIIIENSYNNLSVCLDRIFEKGYSTKGEKCERGLGLWKIKKIVESSNDLELRTYVRNLFTQELLIKDSNNNFLLSEKSEKVLFN